MQGPDFPTGGIIIDDRASIIEAYRTGRGGFRVRARWTQEELARGTWQIVVTEIPYLVQKSRLIEKIAELLTAKKLPLLADVRDEVAEDVRLVLEPKSRTVDPLLLMEQLFRNTELEARIPLNMNVLSHGKVPKVMSLKARAARMARPSQGGAGPPLQLPPRPRSPGAWKFSKAISIAYLNLDEVIRIIREEDEPKPALIDALQAHRHPGRSHPQHAAAGPAQARGNGNPQRARQADEGTEGPQGPAEIRRRAVGDDLRRDQGGEGEVLQEDAARPPPHRFRRGARDRRRFRAGA